MCSPKAHAPQRQATELQAGDSLPERPSRPVLSQTPWSLSEPSCPIGRWAGSPQLSSQRRDKGGSWGTEPISPARLPVRPDGAGGDLRDSRPLCSGPRDSHKSSIKLKAPHLNSNRKRQEAWRFPEPALPPPPVVAALPAESCPHWDPQAPLGRRGTRVRAFPRKLNPGFWWLSQGLT